MPCAAFRASLSPEAVRKGLSREAAEGADRTLGEAVLVGSKAMAAEEAAKAAEVEEPCRPGPSVATVQSCPPPGRLSCPVLSNVPVLV